MDNDTHDTNPSATPGSSVPPGGGEPHPSAVTTTQPVIGVDRHHSRDLHDVAPARRIRVSWGAILAGAVIATSVTALLTLLGVGIGLISSDNLTGADTLATGAAIWYVISGTIGLFIGGYAAGRLAGSPTTKDALLHGLTTWGTTTILAAWLSSMLATSVISGAIGLTNSALQATGTAVGGVASATGQVAASGVSVAGDAVGAIPAPDLDVPWGEVQELANDLVNKAGIKPGQRIEQAEGSPIDSTQAFIENVRAWLEGEDSVTKDELVEFVTNNSNLSRIDIAENLDELKSAYQTAKTQATEAYEAAKDTATDAYQTAKAETGEAVDTAVSETKQAVAEGYETGTDALGSAALWAFVVLLLGAVAASIGGVVGKPDEDAYATRG